MEVRGSPNKVKGMVSLPDFKKALGPLANTLTEKEIERIRISMDQFADVVFDQWLKGKNLAVIRNYEPINQKEKLCSPVSSK